MSMQACPEIVSWLRSHIGDTDDFQTNRELRLLVWRLTAGIPRMRII